MERDEMLEKYTQMLKSHDWYYMCSDSASVYSSGLRSYESILRVKKRLGEDGDRLFNEIAPKEFRG